jgi:5'-methylthioadenosine phosphorylase
MAEKKLQDTYDIAIIGGTGFSDQDKDFEWVQTDYGPIKIFELNIAGKKVAYYERHQWLEVPDLLNRRAYIQALNLKGVQSVISVSATGRLSEDVLPGHIVIPEHFDPFELAERDSYTEEGFIMHAHDPIFSPGLADLLREASTSDIEGKIRKHYQENDAHLPIPLETKITKKGIYSNINGPYFLPKVTEDRLRGSLKDGGHTENLVVGMTAREAILARELGMDYSVVAMVTDYSSLLPPDGTFRTVDHEDVAEVAEVTAKSAFYVIENALLKWNPNYEKSKKINIRAKDVDFKYILSDRVREEEKLTDIPKIPRVYLAAHIAKRTNTDINKLLEPFKPTHKYL